MPEPTNKKTSAAALGFALGRGFMVGDGLRVVELLAAQSTRDDSQARVFGAELSEQIRSYAQDPNPDLVMPILTGFLVHASPSLKRGDLCKWACTAFVEHRHNGAPILAEDLYRLKEDLAYFDNVRQSAPFKLNKDNPKIGDYPSYQALMDTLKRYKDVKAMKEEARLAFKVSDEQRDIINNETTTLYDGPEGKVVVVHTPRASKYWGRNTKWCISGEKTADSYFPIYHLKSPIVFLLPKTGGTDSKIAVVGNTIYNAEDKTIPALPDQHAKLFVAAQATHTDLVQTMQALLPQDKAKNPEAQQEQAGQVLTTTLPADQQAVIGRIPRRASIKDLAKSIPSEWWQQKSFVLVAVTQHGRALEYTSDRLRDDPEIVLAAVSLHGLALQYASARLRDDPKVVLAAVTQYGSALRGANMRLRDDPELVLAAVKQDGRALEYASARLRDDPEIVLAAVTQNGWTLEYASARLRDDPKIVLAAITQYGRALEYTSERLRDESFMLTAVTQHGRALEYASEYLRSDRDFIVSLTDHLIHAHQSANPPKIDCSAFAHMKVDAKTRNQLAQKYLFAMHDKVEPGAFAKAAHAYLPPQDAAQNPALALAYPTAINQWFVDRKRDQDVAPRPAKALPKKAL
jgi:hypothetical protein